MSRWYSVNWAGWYFVDWGIGIAVRLFFSVFISRRDLRVEDGIITVDYGVGMRCQYWCQFPFLVNAVNGINGTPSVVSFHSMYTLQSNLMEKLSVVSLNAVVDNNRWLHAWVLGHFSLPEFHNSNAWITVLNH